MATKLNEYTKRHEPVPFLMADLKKFLPPFCPEHVAVTLEASVDSGGAARPKELARKLEFPSWLVAWDRYSLAATILDQMTFSQTVLHKHVVTEVPPHISLALQMLLLHALCAAQVASHAAAEERHPLLGVLYDEIVRSCGRSQLGSSRALVWVLLQGALAGSELQGWCFL